MNTLSKEKIKSIIDNTTLQTIEEAKHYINGLVSKRFESAEALKIDIETTTGLKINICKGLNNDGMDYVLDGEIDLGNEEYIEFIIFYLIPKNKTLYITEVGI